MEAKTPPPPRWFSHWRVAQRPAAIDAADLGTCFGLDVSLDEVPEAPASPRPARPGWLQRWRARRSGE